jgi:hypothetical protein
LTWGVSRWPDAAAVAGDGHHPLMINVPRIAPGRGVVDPEGAPLAAPSPAQVAGVVAGCAVASGRRARERGGMVRVQLGQWVKGSRVRRAWCVSATGKRAGVGHGQGRQAEQARQRQGAGQQRQEAEE